MKENFMKTWLVALMMLLSGTALAQEDNGFKKIDVKQDFAENGFAWFHDAELLAAGNVPKRQYSNFPAGLHTMYIGEVVNAWKK